PHHVVPARIVVTPVGLAAARGLAEVDVLAGERVSHLPTRLQEPAHTLAEEVAGIVLGPPGQDVYVPLSVLGDTQRVLYLTVLQQRLGGDRDAIGDTEVGRDGSEHRPLDRLQRIATGLEGRLLRPGHRASADADRAAVAALRVGRITVVVRRAHVGRDRLIAAPEATLTVHDDVVVLQVGRRHDVATRRPVDDDALHRTLRHPVRRHDAHATCRHVAGVGGKVGADLEPRLASGGALGAP